MPLAFQYGSNCSAERLNSAERLEGKATSLTVARTVDPYHINFAVYSSKNRCAAATLQPSPGSTETAWGVLYEIPLDRLFGWGKNKMTLQRIEGGQYKALEIPVETKNLIVVTAWTFVAKENVPGLKTSPEYVAHIIKGLREHGVADEYLQSIIHRAIDNNSDEEDSFRRLL
jgi:hypothetical protein